MFGVLFFRQGLVLGFLQVGLVLLLMALVVGLGEGAYTLRIVGCCGCRGSVVVLVMVCMISGRLFQSCQRLGIVSVFVPHCLDVLLMIVSRKTLVTCLFHIMFHTDFLGFFQTLSDFVIVPILLLDVVVQTLVRG